MRAAFNASFARMLILVLPLTLCFTWLLKEFELTNLRRAAVAELRSVPGEDNQGITRFDPVAATPAEEVHARVASRRDCELLMHVGSAIGGDNWPARSGWGEAADCCEWKGVSCASGGVSGLTLSPDAGVRGTLPTELGSLASLKVLDLNEASRLSGTLPTELANARSLSQIFAFGAASLSGTLPSAWPRSLQELELSRCRLSGTLPPQLGGCSGLKYLFLESNAISGVLPSSLGSLPRLRELELSGNRLSGSVPRSLASKALDHLDLKDNSPKLIGAPTAKPSKGCSGGSDRYLRGQPGGAAARSANASASASFASAAAPARARSRRNARKPWLEREVSVPGS